VAVLAAEAVATGVNDDFKVDDDDDAACNNCAGSARANSE
jgi:hypothetical protein